MAGRKGSRPASGSPCRSRFRSRRSPTQGDAQIELKATDPNFESTLLQPYTVARHQYESPLGYVKVLKVNGQPGWEEWNAADKTGELHALVGARFLVQLTGREIERTRVLHELAGKIDLQKLGSLK